MTKACTHWMRQYDMQYYIQLRDVPESLRPINFPGPPAHLKIKRTRKCQIERAKFMDHTGYEWSQWWHKTARKSKRWK